MLEALRYHLVFWNLSSLALKLFPVLAYLDDRYIGASQLFVDPLSINNSQSRRWSVPHVVVQLSAPSPPVEGVIISPDQGSTSCGNL